MKDYNKKNLRRLLSVFAALLIVFLSVVTFHVSLRWWWASLPTSGAAIAAAVALFRKGFVEKEQ